MTMPPDPDLRRDDGARTVNTYDDRNVAKNAAGGLAFLAILAVLALIALFVVINWVN